MPKILISKAFSFLYFIVLSLTNGTTYQENVIYSLNFEFYKFSQKLNELPEKARQFAKLSVQSIRLRDFFKIACYRSEWLGCRFLFLPAHSIYGFSKELEIRAI